MKIKFRSFSRSALGKYRPGSVADLPDEVALKFLNKGYADPVKEDITEKAVLSVENMTDTSMVNIGPKAEVPVVNPAKKKKKKRK